MKRLALLVLASLLFEGCAHSNILLSYSLKGVNRGAAGWAGTSSGSWGEFRASWEYESYSKRLNLVLEGHSWLSVFGDPEKWDNWWIATDQFVVESDTLGGIVVDGIRSDAPVTHVRLRPKQRANAPHVYADLRGFSDDLKIEVLEGDRRRAPTPSEDAWLRKQVTLKRDRPESRPPAAILEKGESGWWIDRLPEPEGRSCRIVIDAKRAIEESYKSAGSYPAAGAETLFNALFRPDRRGDPFIRHLEQRGAVKEGRIVDGYGRPLVYRRELATDFICYSLGEDGEDQGGAWDDIRPR